jgi:hypothetical protein
MVADMSRECLAVVAAFTRSIRQWMRRRRSHWEKVDMRGGRRGIFPLEIGFYL